MLTLNAEVVFGSEVGVLQKLRLQRQNNCSLFQFEFWNVALFCKRTTRKRTRPYFSEIKSAGTVIGASTVAATG